MALPEDDFDTLNRSVAERSWTEEPSRSAERPAPPRAGGHIAWDPAHGSGSIALPPLGLSAGRVLGLLLLLARAGAITLPLPVGPVAGWLAGLFFIGLGLAILNGSLRGWLAREVIREERDGLLFHETLLGKRRRERFLPKRKIEEIAVAPVIDAEIRTRRVRSGMQPHEVTVRSDRQVVKVGGTLTREEQLWLEQALTYLAAR